MRCADLNLNSLAIAPLWAVKLEYATYCHYVHRPQFNMSGEAGTRKQADGISGLRIEQVSGAVEGSPNG